MMSQTRNSLYEQENFLNPNLPGGGDGAVTLFGDWLLHLKHLGQTQRDVILSH